MARRPRHWYLGVRTLVATDFDGTIAGIRSDPATVEIDASALALLRELEDDPEVSVAIISGRSLDELSVRTAGIRCWRSGSHGLEISSPDGRILREPLRTLPELDAHVEAEVRDAGLRLERKRFGVALHWRDMEIDDDSAAIRSFRNWATARELKVTHGRRVLEASISGDGKREALQFIETQTGADRLLFAGDDLTDFEALEYVAKSGGVAIFVVTAERVERPSGAFRAVSSVEELIATIRAELKSGK